MSTSTRRFDVARERQSRMETAWAILRHVLGLPARVYRARRLMTDLGRMGEHELGDIGLTRQDLHDAAALGLDVDPSVALRRRVDERRRRR